MRGLFDEAPEFGDIAISPLKEMAAYEALWERSGASFSRLATMFKGHPHLRPSDIVCSGIVNLAT